MKVRQDNKRKRRKKIKILVFVIIYELIAVMYCCTGIVILSNDLTFEMMSRAVVASLDKPVFDPAPPVQDGIDAYEEEHRWKGPVLSRSRGSIIGPSGKETYYNLNMSGVVRIMRNMGNNDEYWVRDDGCKMLGDYIMVAANLNIRPRGTIVETSLGPGIVCDTGGFARRNPYQIDIAVTW